MVRVEQPLQRDPIRLWGARAGVRLDPRRWPARRWPAWRHFARELNGTALVTQRVASRLKQRRCAVPWLRPGAHAEQSSVAASKTRSRNCVTRSRLRRPGGDPRGQISLVAAIKELGSQPRSDLADFLGGRTSWGERAP